MICIDDVLLLVSFGMCVPCIVFFFSFFVLFHLCSKFLLDPSSLSLPCRIEFRVSSFELRISNFDRLVGVLDELGHLVDKSLFVAVVVVGFATVFENNGTLFHGGKLLHLVGPLAKEFFPRLVLAGGGESDTKVVGREERTKGGIVIDYAQVATPVAAPDICGTHFASEVGLVVVLSAEVGNNVAEGCWSEAFGLVGDHLDVGIILVGLVEGLHHGCSEKVHGCIGRLDGILQLEGSLRLAVVDGRDNGGGGDEGKSGGKDFHHHGGN
mmetsp:Transcript_931/g.2373  ORF Transcript_931/g.2373 Transcript_931/m.2373 type:complete len:268 (-) Transcript_931:396-1199(-)